MDKLSLERATKAHPGLRAELAKIYIEANNKLGKGVRLRFTHVLRTFKEQDALYAQGRTKGKRGAVVTNARAGQSYHNYGLAVDICILLDKNNDGTFETASFDPVKDSDCDGLSDWLEVVAVFKKYGWKWGGDWRFKDLPHFEKTGGKTWRELRTLYDSKKVDSEGYVKINF